MENRHPQLDLEHRLACTSSMEHLSGGLQPLKLPNAHNVVHLSRMQAEPSGTPYPYRNGKGVYLTLGRLMDIPKHIRLYHIEATFLGFSDECWPHLSFS
ncbi:hypothetical protein C2845_PM06G20910 [Panicum miliaceum]|uniref:Uncharacterized protein n=1 Tax=Panicum miliaceum TaxID=4540 RepID=A0A3L6RFG2_PANMI|nr:hypothetical protein C2845_PM06G20910 [Panicum miliaceum]